MVELFKLSSIVTKRQILGGLLGTHTVLKHKNTVFDDIQTVRYGEF